MKFTERLRSGKFLAAFFDWDGTLIRFREQGFLESINITLDRFGHKGIGSLKESVSVRHTFAKFIHCPQKREEAFEVFRQEFSKFPLSETDLMLGVRETLTQIKNYHGVSLGVVSNLDHKLLTKEVTKVGLNDYFSVIIGSENDHHLKPKPDLIIKAIIASGFTPSKRILYVGDSLSDVTAANKAGCLSVLVGRKPQTENIIPDKIIDNLYGVRELVKDAIRESDQIIR